MNRQQGHTKFILQSTNAQLFTSLQAGRIQKNVLKSSLKAFEDSCRTKSKEQGLFRRTLHVLEVIQPNVARMYLIHRIFVEFQ